MERHILELFLMGIIELSVQYKLEIRLRIFRTSLLFQQEAS